MRKRAVDITKLAPSKKLELAQSLDTSVEILRQLALDSSAMIRYGVAANTRTPDDVLMSLASDKDSDVLREVAKRATTEEMIREIYRQRDPYADLYLALKPQLPVDIARSMIAGSNNLDRTIARHIKDGDVQRELLHKSLSVRRELASNKYLVLDVLDELSQDKDLSIRLDLAKNSKSLPPEIIARFAADTQFQVIAALAENPSTPAEMLAQLAEMDNVYVRQCVGKNVKTPNKVLQKLAADTHYTIRSTVARNEKAGDKLLEQLAQDKNEDVRLAVAWNEQAGIKALTKIVSLMHEGDEEVIKAVSEHPNCSAELMAELSHHAKLNQLFPLNTKLVPSLPYKQVSGKGVDSKIDTDVELLYRVLHWVKENPMPVYNTQMLLKEEPFFKTRLPVLKKYLPADKFALADIEAAIKNLKDSRKGDDKFEQGFTYFGGVKEDDYDNHGDYDEEFDEDADYEGSDGEEPDDQQYLTSNHNLVLQVNLKPAYLQRIFSKMGSGFRDWYIKVGKAILNSSHPVLPIPGHTIGWIRLHDLSSDTWLINEIQEDWGTIKATAKSLANGDLDSMTDANGNRVPISPKLQGLLSQPEHLEWLEYITGDILKDYEKILMQAVLDLARDHGVRHIYMLPHGIQTHIVSPSKRKILYDDLPKKFHFEKKHIDLHSKYDVNDTYDEPEYYWYRTARKKAQTLSTLSTTDKETLTWDPELDPAVLAELATDTDDTIRGNVAGHKNTPPMVLSRMVDDKDPWVRAIVADNANTPIPTLIKLARDPEEQVREKIAYREDLIDSVSLVLAKDPVDRIRQFLAQATNSPKVLAVMAKDDNYVVRMNVAKNDHAHKDALDVLAGNVDEHIRRAAMEHPNFGGRKMFARKMKVAAMYMMSMMKQAIVIEENGHWFVADDEGNKLPANPVDKDGNQVGHKTKLKAVSQLMAIETARSRSKKK